MDGTSCFLLAHTSLPVHLEKGALCFLDPVCTYYTLQHKMERFPMQKLHWRCAKLLFKIRFRNLLFTMYSVRMGNFTARGVSTRKAVSRSTGGGPTGVNKPKAAGEFHLVEDVVTLLPAQPPHLFRRIIHSRPG